MLTNECDKSLEVCGKVRRNTPPSTLKNSWILDSSLNGVEKFRVAETISYSAYAERETVSTELRSSGWLKLACACHSPGSFRSQRSWEVQGGWNSKLSTMSGSMGMSQRSWEVQGGWNLRYWSRSFQGLTSQRSWEVQGGWNFFSESLYPIFPRLNGVEKFRVAETLMQKKLRWAIRSQRSWEVQGGWNQISPYCLLFLSPSQRSWEVQGGWNPLLSVYREKNRVSTELRSSGWLTE